MYAGIRCCTPAEFLDALRAALTLPHVEALRRRLRVAGPSTVMAAAEQWAASADYSTGRGVAVSHATIAAAIAYAPATVKRIARFLSRLGFLVECARGRDRLTREELAQARSQGAVNQRAVASTRALTIPESVDGTPLPSTHSTPSTPHVSKTKTTRASARRMDASRPSATANPTPPAPSHVSGQAYWQLTDQLIQRIPGLAAVTAGFGRLFHLLRSRNVIEHGWTASQILDRIDAHNAAARITPAHAAEQRDPVSYFTSMFTRAVTGDSPSRTLARERQERHARHAAQAKALAEQRARVAAERADIDQIIVTMRAQR